MSEAGEDVKFHIASFCIKKPNGFKVQDVTEDLGIPRQNVYYYLKKFVEAELLTQVGHTYKITEDGYEGLLAEIVGLKKEIDLRDVDIVILPEETIKSIRRAVQYGRLGKSMGLPVANEYVELLKANFDATISMLKKERARLVNAGTEPKHAVNILKTSWNLCDENGNKIAKARNTTEAAGGYTLFVNAITGQGINHESEVEPVWDAFVGENFEPTETE